MAEAIVQTEVVISRYFAQHYVADALPRNTRVEREPAYKLQLRMRMQREEKRKKRKSMSSPPSVPSMVPSAPPLRDTAAT